MNQIAWSVGGFYSKDKGAGKYYKECTNANSVSIELCDATKGYTAEQAKAVKKLIKYIKRYCPNAKTVIRHWDVNGKDCPHPMIGKDNKMWKQFKKTLVSKIDRTCDEKRLFSCAKRCKIKLSQTRQFKFWRGVRVHCVTLPLTLKLRGNNQSCKFMIDNYEQMFYNCLIVRRATWEMKTKMSSFTKTKLSK